MKKFIAQGLIIIAIILIAGCGTTGGLLSLISSSQTIIADNDNDDDGGISTGIFLASYLQQDLVLWLDSSEISTLNAGENVLTWIDKSPSENNAIDTTGFPPEYQTDVINGFPVVRFDTNEILTFSEDILVGSNWSMFIVFRMPFNPAACHPKFIVNDTSEQHLVVEDSSSRLGSATGGSFSWTGFALNTLSNGGHVVTAIADTTNTFYYVDKNPAGTNNIVVSAPMRRLGNRSARDGGFGDFAEVLIYRKVLTNDEIDEVENYLDRKWGLGLGL